MCVSLRPTCCPGRSSPWVSRGCRLGLGSGAEQQLGGGRFAGGMCGIHRRREQGDEERLSKCPAVELGTSLGDRIRKDRESNTDLVFVATNFSPLAIIKSLWSLANHSSLAPGEKNHRVSKKKNHMNEPDIVFASFELHRPGFQRLHGAKLYLLCSHRTAH